MPKIILNDFSITPDSFANGSTPVQVTYDCDIEDASQNPITAKLFVLSALAVSFDVSTWEDTLQPGNNVISTGRNILAHSNISEDKLIKIRIRLEDADGLVATQVTNITYSA
jgi:hypothetical protein